MTKHIGITLGIISLCIVITALFFRVHFLENRQKAFASLPSSAMQPFQGNIPPVGKDDYVIGKQQAGVTLIEYSDFECPSCQRMHPVFQKIVSQFGNNIRFVERMFPLPQNKNAEKEAEAALCAGKLGGEKAYFQYGNEIFRRTKGTEGGEGFALDKLIPLAKELGLSEDTFRTCLDSGEMARHVGGEKEGGEHAGVNQLPSLFIVDKNQHVTYISGEQSLSTLQIILTYAVQE